MDIYIFVKAFDIELRDKNWKLLKDKNDNPILGTEAINNLRENFLHTGRDFPVISIDKNGNIVHYENIKEAAKKTANKRENIAQVLLNGKITQGKYTYAHLADVVLIDKFGDVVFDYNNDFVINYNKIEQMKKKLLKK